MEMVRQFLSDASGAGLTEYALLVAFIAIALVLALQALSGAVGGVFTRAQTGLGS